MGTHTTCHRCGYDWEYGGSKDRYCTCPNCKTSTPVGGDTTGSSGSSSDSSNGSSNEQAPPETVAVEDVTVETEMWGEQELDEFGETVSDMVVRPVEFGAASKERVERLEETVREQQETIRQLRSDVAALYEAVGEKAEHGYMVTTEDGAAWVPSSSDPYDPTGEFSG